MIFSRMTSMSDADVVKTLKPVSTVEFVLTNGSVVKTDSILNPEDFIRIFNNPFNRTVKVCAGGSKYMFIRKKTIASFNVMPLA